MARFVDLDEEPEAADTATWPSGCDRIAPMQARGHIKPKDGEDLDHASMSRVQLAMTEALGCYPIVTVVASHIDLNTLDALARTCRGVHDGLLQYRSILLTSTLHCSREAAPVNGDAVFRYRARASNWHYMEDGRSFGGKSGDCARDMVQECRRCGQVICRNCAIKPPAPVALRERHRRLCVTCARAPLASLLGPPLDMSAPLSYEAIHQAVCSCDDGGVWLCQPCGRGIRNTDCGYQQIWHWRSHYGEILGGLGTGIGDGDRGVVCGRETRCLAAREIEQEVDCDAEDARSYRDSESTPRGLPLSSATSSPSTTSLMTTDNAAFPVAIMPMTSLLQNGHHHDNEPALSPQIGPGYERHEIEGIGGRVKRKLVRMVRVGACVPEAVDEMGFGSRVLGPEVRGDVRSWCGWCWRVIPASQDMASLGAGARSTEQQSAGARRFMYSQ